MLDVSTIVLAGDRVESAEGDRVRDLKLRLPAAWTGLYDAYYVKIRRLAWAKLRSIHEADDVAATVFMRALASIDSYQYRGTPIIAWLYRIAANVIKERQRKAWREHRSKPFDDVMASDIAAVAEDPEHLVRRLDLLDAIARLTKDQRTVITLVYVSGFSVREVADMLGKGERAIYYLQARGLMKLKQYLA